jgi:hypothetical protein
MNFDLTIFEDAKRTIRSRNSKKERPKENGIMDFSGLPNSP